MRYFCRVEYDGTRYAGWQVQDDRNTVQAELERAFSVIGRIECSVTGAGRTDAGVHALGQGMHVDLPEITDVARFQRSVNAILPFDIAIYNMQAVAPEFHARYSAIQRRYIYTIVLRKMPLWNKRALHVYYPVDWNRIRAQCSFLVGEHDFSAFCASGHDKPHCICSVTIASVSIGEQMVTFTISANRFVYKMVRSIVGTLLEIGSGKIECSMREIIQARNHVVVGDTAPPYGLVLDYVQYEGIA